VISSDPVGVDRGEETADMTPEAKRSARVSSERQTFEASRHDIRVDGELSLGRR
jgi:hypothetical protein